MATIQNETARRMMYEWHGGMPSAFYAAASSGLVASFAQLAAECATIDEPDRAKLMAWIQKRQAKFKTETVVSGRAYRILPWVSRSYFPKGA
jgi:hypothetical protein